MSKNQLSKEEYIQAITRLYENSYVDLKDCDLFSNLIAEHFDNPPLKFEELKVGMWVWDNKHKVYNCISRIYQNLYPNVNAIQFKHLNEATQWGNIIEFEENRFYRKQVE